MLDVLLMWPKDQSGVQDEWVSKVLSILKEASGLRQLRVSEGDLMGRGGPPPYSRVIEASFESIADWMAHVDVLNSRPDLAPYKDAAPPLVVFFEARDA